MNQTEIAQALRALGLARGMEVEVHASLSSIGYVQGGARAVIGALMEVVGEEGSIFMPALRLSGDLPLTPEDAAMGIARKIKILAREEEKTAMGQIADAFRARADVVTGPGVFAVSAWGRGARFAGEGFGYILRRGGHALLLGVDIYSLTAMHTVEDRLPREVRDIFRPTAEMNAKYPPDAYWIEAGAPPKMAWYEIQEKAERAGLIARGRVGRALCRFFKALDVVELYRRALETDAYALYGLERLDVCDKTGAPTGRVVVKHAPLFPGEYLPHAVILLKTRSGQYILQKRSSRARHSPGRWDVTGGGISHGETGAQAAAREAFEELGVKIQPEDAVFLGKYASPWENGENGNVVYVYAARADAPENGFALSPREVEDARLAPYDEFVQTVMYNKPPIFAQLLRRAEETV